MSIQSEIDRIKAGKADAKAALIERGVDPGDATIDEYGNQIRAIPTGVTSFNDRTGAVEPQAGDYTADMVGARPDTWMPTATEVGARPDSWTPTADEVGAVPTTRTVNGKPLSGNVSLVAADIGALPISGGTLTGPLNCGGRLLRGVANPASGQDAVNLQYLNSVVGNINTLLDTINGEVI